MSDYYYTLGRYYVATHRHGDPIIPARIKGSAMKISFLGILCKFQFSRETKLPFGLCNVTLLSNKEIPAGVIKSAKIKGVTNNM